MNSEWKWVRCDEFIDFNPKETLKKGTISKKVAMENVLPHQKYVNSYTIDKYNGGSKFRNNDVLFARITPCLENGKTSQINFLEENEIGFGSTEFIILRNKDNISDISYIYYLAISNIFRNQAIKSMTGTSGRQRVQIDSLKSLEIKIPPLTIQKKISAIFSNIDNKIEVNKKINKNFIYQLLKHLILQTLILVIMYLVI